MFFHDFPDLIQGNTHFDTQSLGFIAAGYGTTVVVGQDDDRTPVQTGVEYPFTTEKKLLQSASAYMVRVF